MTPSATNGRPLGELARLRRVHDRIDREYAQPLDVEALARGVNMSAGHLSRQFRLAYGESPYACLMTRRIERAMALLRRGDLGITEVCFAVGCSSLGTFSTRFTYAMILLATGDLDGTFARLEADGAEIVQEPAEQPYGVRDCAVRDPAGNLVRIQERR